MNLLKIGQFSIYVFADLGHFDMKFKLKMKAFQK